MPEQTFVFTLDDPSCIPPSVLRSLAAKRKVFEHEIYFSHLLEHPEIREAAELATFSQLPFARTLLGNYIRRLNPAFQVESLEAPMKRSVDPTEVLCVHEKDVFFKNAIMAGV
jgi:hypothetical protein